MRSRGSLVGPLLLILIGVVFLLRAISPNFQIWDLFRLYWPYLLIAWGVLSFIEVCIRFITGAPIPVNAVSGGAWFLVVLICIAGVTTWEVSRQYTWWRHFNFQHEFAALGEDHEFSVAPQQIAVGATPHVVIERFRGDAKITAADGKELDLSGHKSVRAFDAAATEEANRLTPVQVTVEGSTVVIRCNQDKADSRTQVSTYLDITVPKGASVEATGTNGDFEISGINGDVDVSSDNAGVRLQDLGGNATVQTRKSDLIRAVNVQGAVDLEGHGDDVELDKIAGQVTIKGDYTGTVSLHDVSQPVRVEDMRTHLEVAQIPGEVRLERGNLSLQNIVGPVKLTTHDTDVDLDGVSNEISLAVDKGDIEVRPGRVPLGRMMVKTRSGNIELALPEEATFALDANTDHGEIDNEFGDNLRQQTQGRGAHLRGTMGDGPDLVLNTGRGSITVRKAAVESVTGTKVARGSSRVVFAGV